MKYLIREERHPLFIIPKEKNLQIFPTMPTCKATASVDGQTIAETTEWEEVEGNVYFPPQAVRKDEYFTDTDLHTHCPWKGDASYYTITVGGRLFLKVLRGLKKGTED